MTLLWAFPARGYSDAEGSSMDLEASEDSSPRTPVTQCQGASIYYERSSRIFFEEVRVGGRHHVVFKYTKEAGTEACHLSD